MIAPGAARTGNRVNMTVGAATAPASFVQGIGLMLDGSIAGDTDAPTGTRHTNGFRQNAAGALYVTTTTAGTDIWINGLRVSLLGQLVYVDAEPNTYVNGNPIATDGRLAVAPGGGGGGGNFILTEGSDSLMTEASDNIVTEA